MVNKLHSLLHRPEKGWDPVSSSHAEKYAQEEWQGINWVIVDELEQRIGGFEGKRVLDLGGGPGQYSVAFANRGALVTWHDISCNYRKIAQEHARKAGVEVEFSLGYLEDSKRFVGNPFDLVFCRICWYYCMNDCRFARLFYSLVRSGGAGYIDASNSKFEAGGLFRRFQYFLNNRFYWKIGHPHPPQGRIASLLNSRPLDFLNVDYSIAKKDRIFFIKTNMHRQNGDQDRERRQTC